MQRLCATDLSSPERHGAQNARAQTNVRIAEKQTKYKLSVHGPCSFLPWSQMCCADLFMSRMWSSVQTQRTQISKHLQVSLVLALGCAAELWAVLQCLPVCCSLNYNPTCWTPCLLLTGQTELPTCPVCLERLDEHISGVVTTVSLLNLQKSACFTYTQFVCMQDPLGHHIKAAEFLLVASGYCLSVMCTAL